VKTQLHRIGRWLAALALSVTILAIAVAGWGMLSYARLVELDQAVVAAGARVEAASRVRIELVENLIESGRAFDCVEDATFAAVEQALRDVRARDAVLSGPSTVGKLPDVRATQSDLGSALKTFCERARAGTDASLAAIVVDLEPRLERWQQAIAKGLDDFEAAAEAYGEEVRAFPGSVVSGVAELERGFTGIRAAESPAPPVPGPAG
jgi:LemA protein